MKKQFESDLHNGTNEGEKVYSANMLVHYFLTDSAEYNLDSARFWLTEFRYELPRAEIGGKVVITSVDGKLVGELAFKGRKGSLPWDTNTVATGVYFYSLWADGKKIHIERLVVLK